MALAAARVLAAAPRETSDHECQLFGYVFAGGAGDAGVLDALCDGLYNQTLPQRTGDAQPRVPQWVARESRPSPSRDGWGFGYFLAPPHPGIARPLLLKGGPPACEDQARWDAASGEVALHGLSGAGAVLGHVRKSSYGPDSGALPNPHPFSDSLGGRWWLFAHNGHMIPDTLLGWIPGEFLARHPLDYDELPVDSEVLFRYYLLEIARRGSVRDALLYACHRIKEYDDFVFNICLTDGDTLWTARSVSTTPFYYTAVADSAAWWASTVRGSGSPRAMSMHRLYWFFPGGMGSASYD